MYHAHAKLGFLIALAALLATGGAACAPSATEQAMSLARQHREAEGIHVLREQLQKHPDDVRARRLLVRLLAFSGDMVAAKSEVEELERRLPGNDPLPYIELGHAYELTHHFEEALMADDDAGKIAPDSPAGPREGGMRCARWGEVEEARPRLEEAIRRGARDADTWHALGLVRLHLKDYAGAEEAYRAGASADPKGAENWLGLATLAVVREDAEAALAAYDAVLERRPRYAAAELGRAWALARLGRKDEAARALDLAEQLGAPPEYVAKQRASLR
jgi:tetratricopeptide (TPR) repeat protein